MGGGGGGESISTVTELVSIFSLKGHMGGGEGWGGVWGVPEDVGHPS